jgi:uncharacterized protein YacL
MSFHSMNHPDSQGAAPLHTLTASSSSGSPIDAQALHPAEAAARQRRLLVRAVRVAFLVLMVTLTVLAVIRQLDLKLAESERRLAFVPLIAGAVLLLIGLGIDLLTPRKKIQTITGAIIGILAGLLAAATLGFVVDLLLESWVEPAAFVQMKPVINSIKLLIGVALCYLGVATVLQTQDDFRLVIPYVEFAKQIRGPRPMLLDSSALIDARILDVGATNILQVPLVIPRFVIAELQQLADSADALKRTKGRRGLDTISKLQRAPMLDVSVDESIVPGKAVDQMLVELARTMSGLVVTSDVALARIAGIQGVPVINLNDLANALKPNVVPGESLSIKLVRPGEQPSQGVGYLADGTMIVVEDGGNSIGETVSLTVTSSLQTSAGRLIFGRIGEKSGVFSPPPRDPAPTPDAPSSHASTDTDPPAELGHLDSEPAADDAAPSSSDPSRPRTPFPPKPPRSIRGGTPRNPRR